MFNENFSFQQSPAPSWTPKGNLSNQSTSACSRFAQESRFSRSVSPCSAPSSTSPPSSFTVTDLAAQFASQRIHRAAQICYDSCEAYANTVDDDADWAIPQAATAQHEPTSASITSPPACRPYSRLRIATPESSVSLSSASSYSNLALSRRSQRQSSTRLLCASSTHQRDLAALVSRMIDGEDQCCLNSSSSLATSRRSSTGAGNSNHSSDASSKEVCCTSPTCAPLTTSPTSLTTSPVISSTAILSSSPVDSILAMSTPSPCPSAEDDQVEDALMLDDEDEGYDSSSAASSVSGGYASRKSRHPRLEYRRASDYAALHATSACVSKKLRLRCRHHRRTGTAGA